MSISDLLLPFAWLLLKALGMKRLASEDLVHGWDNKRLNAGTVSVFLILVISQTSLVIVFRFLFFIYLLRGSRQQGSSNHIQHLIKWLEPVLNLELERIHLLEVQLQLQIYKSRFHIKLQHLLFLERGRFLLRLLVLQFM